MTTGLSELWVLPTASARSRSLQDELDEPWPLFSLGSEAAGGIGFSKLCHLKNFRASFRSHTNPANGCPHRFFLPVAPQDLSKNLKMLGFAPIRAAARSCDHTAETEVPDFIPGTDLRPAHVLTSAHGSAHTSHRTLGRLDKTGLLPSSTTTFLPSSDNICCTPIIWSSMGDSTRTL